MTKEEKFSLAKLQAFTSNDFEQYRERGEEYRLRLSSAVIAALSLPEYWRVDCEIREEWGGLHPVYLRLYHFEAPSVPIEILSPCYESPYWYGRMQFEAGTCTAWFYSRDGFDTTSILDILRMLDEYIRAGYTEANALAVALRMGGHAV